MTVKTLLGFWVHKIPVPGKLWGRYYRYDDLKVDFWHFFGFWLDKDTDNLSNVGMKINKIGVGGSRPGTSDAECPGKGYFFCKQEPFLRAFFLGAFAPLEGHVYDGDCPVAGQVF